MAEGCVIESPVEPDSPKCEHRSAPRDLLVVLTPSVDHPSWLRALQKAGADAGLDVVEMFEPLPPVDSGSKGRLAVCMDASLAEPWSAEDIVVIMPQPETASEATGEIFCVEPPGGMFHASILLARAAALSPPVKVLTAWQLAKKPAAIELFPGVVAAPPLGERGAQTVAVGQALGLYRNGPPAPGAKAQWTERLFVYDENSVRGSQPPGVLDITGRPRTLVYGPYIALPPGRWKSEMRFAVDEAAADCLMRFDWGPASDFTVEHDSPKRSGVYQIELEHEVSFIEPWQFRILLMQGAFEGQLSFFGGTVTRL